MLAFDRDAKRLVRLKVNAKAAAASNVEAQQADFLSLPLATDPKFRYRPLIAFCRVRAPTEGRAYHAAGCNAKGS